MGRAIQISKKCDYSGESWMGNMAGSHILNPAMTRNALFFVFEE
jgi:hypothetical protein